MQIQDNIHGLIAIPPIIQQIIDTPEFQRLRNIKQLGSEAFVFTGAQQKRFEHSIGVMYLATKVLDKLGIKNEEQILLTQIAAVCHDLGHGPMSHVYETLFLRKCGITEWHHEKMSITLLKHIIKKYKINISDEQIEIVRKMIMGEDKLGIICNRQNGLDFDKLEYLVRDTRNLGIHRSYDINRIINNCKLIEHKLCYNIKIANDIYDVFNLRYNMYNQFYLHKTVRAIDHMIVDILYLANPVLKITDKIWNPELFYKLDDSIIDIIYNSDDPRLSPAQALIDRIKMRQLYKFVGEFIIEEEYEELEPNDCTIIDQFKLNYSMKNKDPVELIDFYKDNKIVKLDKSQVSYLLPDKYEKKFLRIYCKSTKICDKCKDIYNKLKIEYLCC